MTELVVWRHAYSFVARLTQQLVSTARTQRHLQTVAMETDATSLGQNQEALDHTLIPRGDNEIPRGDYEIPRGHNDTPRGRSETVLNSRGSSQLYGTTGEVASSDNGGAISPVLTRVGNERTEAPVNAPNSPRRHSINNGDNVNLLLNSLSQSPTLQGDGSNQTARTQDSNQNVRHITIDSMRYLGHPQTNVTSGEEGDLNDEVLMDIHDHSGAGGQEQQAEGRGFSLTGDLIDSLEEWSTASAPPSPHRGRRVRARRRGFANRETGSLEDMNIWARLRRMCDSPESANQRQCPQATPTMTPPLTPSPSPVHPAFPTPPSLIENFTALLSAAASDPTSQGSAVAGLVGQGAGLPSQGAGSREGHASSPSHPVQQQNQQQQNLDHQSLQHGQHQQQQHHQQHQQPQQHQQQENQNPPMNNEQSSDLVLNFDILLNRFYYEVFLWMYVNVMLHPRSSPLRTRLHFLSRRSGGGQSVQDVALSLLLGYFSGFHQGRAQLLANIRTALGRIDDEATSGTSGSSWPPEAEMRRLRELSIEMGIQLNPRQMLRTFSTVVRDVVMGRGPQSPNMQATPAPTPLSQTTG